MAEPESHQAQWLDRWAERIHRSGLSVIALPILEVSRGMGFLVSQALLLTQPVLAGLVEETKIDRFVTLFDDPAAIDDLMERIERKANGDG